MFCLLVGSYHIILVAGKINTILDTVTNSIHSTLLMYMFKKNAFFHNTMNTHTHTSILHRLHKILQESVLDEQPAHNVWVDVGSWAAILEVSLSSQLDWERNADG